LRILIINPPHPAIGSRIPDDHLPPLGLLSIGGPLIDDGHDVSLYDAEFGPASLVEIANHITDVAPDLLLIGHSGSTSAHPIAQRIARSAKLKIPSVKIIYGGVFPTYHWEDILNECSEFDIIVRGEGEETCRHLVEALSAGTSLDLVAGIAFRVRDKIVSTPPRMMIADLDMYRIGWELIDFSHYSYWGRKRAVVVQFSRGCPHPCNYCGQRGFWTKWLIAENVDVTLVGSTCADDIVRDRDHLHLYKQAGVERFLMGMENTDEAVLAKIRKGGSTTTDREAIRLMRQHGMLSMATWVVGFEEETDADYWRVLRQLLSYDPDQIQSVYVTPHRWTPFFKEAEHRQVIQGDQSKWDYKHQVLNTRHVPPWRVFVWAKAIEFILQARPRALWRLLTLKDLGFLFRDKRWKTGPSVREFWGGSLEANENALARKPSSSRVRLPIGSLSPEDSKLSSER